MMENQIKFYLSDERCKPVKAHSTDVGYDLRAYDIIKGYQGTNLIEDDKLQSIKNRFIETGYITLRENERILFDSGIKLLYMPTNIELQIRPRSGMSLKRGVLSYFGTIDPDYRGQIGIIVGNSTTFPIRIERFERIAQLVPTAILQHSFSFEDEDYDEVFTIRGESGFGDSGSF